MDSRSTKVGRRLANSSESKARRQARKGGEDPVTMEQLYGEAGYNRFYAIKLREEEKRKMYPFQMESDLKQKLQGTPKTITGSEGVDF